jgi:hypothetical protein
MYLYRERQLPSMAIGTCGYCGTVVSSDYKCGCGAAYAHPDSIRSFSAIEQVEQVATIPIHHTQLELEAYLANAAAAMNYVVSKADQYGEIAPEVVKNQGGWLEWNTNYQIVHIAAIRGINDLMAWHKPRTYREFSRVLVHNLINAFVQQLHIETGIQIYALEVAFWNARQRVGLRPLTDEDLLRLEEITSNF